MVNELKDKGIQRTALWQRGVDTYSFRPDLRSEKMRDKLFGKYKDCLLYTSPSPRDLAVSRMPSSA